MKFLTTKTRSAGGAAKAAARREHVSLYRQLLRNPRAARWLLRDQDTLTPEDVRAIEQWAAVREWHVRLHRGIGERPQVAELLGPEEGDAYALIYRVERGIQIDEWTTKSWVWPSLGEALDFASSYL